MTDLLPAGVSAVTANWGRWVARCPYPHCPDAVQLQRDQATAVCGHCCRGFDVAWPPDPAAIETILNLRPVPATRNWLPGESLNDLMEENIAHDILPPEWTALAQDRPHGQLLLLHHTAGVADGGHLMQAIDARRNQQIGA